MKSKVFITILCFVILFTITVIPCSALEVSPYNHLASTSINANNLISYANSYDSFIYSDFVVLQSGDYEYIIVWGDFSFNGSLVTSSDVEYIRYYRTSSSSYNNYYSYDYGTDNSFRLTLNEYVVTSNINIGMTSTVYDDYRANYNITYLLVICGSLLFANVLTIFRRSH